MNDFYNFIKLMSVDINNLKEGWFVKTFVASVCTFCTSAFFNPHIVMLNVFMALVMIDLLTKQLALSAQYIHDTQKIPKSDIDTWAKWLGIAVAFNNGYIKSLHMRKKFLTKMATYLIAVTSAALVDIVIVHQGNGEYVLSLVYTYLGLTEFISIMENLRDGGNTTIGKVLTFAETKLLSRLK